MDMKCMKCSEPWDWFYIRDEVLEDEHLFQKAKKYGLTYDRFKFSKGVYIEECPACFGKKVEQDDNAKIRASLAYLYGDDTDGFIADMEDFGL